MQLINIGDLFLNNFIIKTKNGLIVVDTGLEGGFESFKSRFIKKGLEFKDIKYIFVTHAHQDHVGFLDILSKETDAKIVLHITAAQRLKTGKVVTEGVRFSNRGLIVNKLMGDKGNRFCPVDLPNRYLLFEKDEQYFKQDGIDIEIIGLPGHTKDSIGLLLNNSMLICGDAAMNNILSKKRQSILIEDANDYKASWEKMIGINPSIIYPSHGKPFGVEDLKRYLDFIL